MFSANEAPPAAEFVKFEKLTTVTGCGIGCVGGFHFSDGTGLLLYREEWGVRGSVREGQRAVTAVVCVCVQHGEQQRGGAAPLQARQVPAAPA